MTTALAVAGVLGAIVSWYHAAQARKAAAQVEAGKKIVASVREDLEAVEAAIKP